MKASVIGAGYVGLTTAVCLADVGHEIICIDKNPEKVKELSKGNPIIYEENMEEKLKRVLKKGYLKFTTEYSDIVKTEITFIAVETPVRENGEMDLSSLEAAVKELGTVLKNKKGYHIVVVKSTVVPGVTKDLVIPLLEKYSGQKVPEEIGVSMNPEFLQEGKAIETFINPGRVVIGEIKGDRRAGDKLVQLYEDFPSRYVIVRAALTEAEMIKFASNAFLATRVSFANEIGNVCDALGINGHLVLEAMTLDPRFGKSHLRPGPPYGGSCLPKEVKGFISKAKQLGCDPLLMESVEEVNERQKVRIVSKAEKILGSLQKKKVAILGLAFKPGSDDVRFSPGVAVAKGLVDKGAEVITYDPMAMENAKKIIGNSVQFANSIEEALRGADCCIITTDWQHFRSMESEFNLMKEKNVLDAFQIIGPTKAKELNLNYHLV
jgi:UDPglucose 6-dehydrogenase